MPISILTWQLFLRLAAILKLEEQAYFGWLDSG